MKRPAPMVWRFQRSPPRGDVVTALTRNRQWGFHMPWTPYWELNFAGRFTFYATAVVAGPLDKPHLRILHEVTEEQWK